MNAKEKELLKSDSLTDLIDYLSERLENPVLLETTNFELITYSGNYQLLDDVRKYTILGKKAPTFIIDCLIEEKVVEAIENSSQPLRLPAIEHINFTERVAYCIRIRNRSAAYLWIQEATRKLTPDDYQLIMKMGNEIASILQNTLDLKNDGQRFFSKLLEGHYTSEKMLSLEAEMVGISIPEEYAIIIIYCADSNPIGTILPFVTSFCQYENKFCYHVRNGNQVTVIVGKDTQNKADIYSTADRIVQMVLNRQASSDSVHIGVSNKSRNLLNVRSHYSEALEVINVRNSFGCKKIPYYYEQLGIYRLLSVVQEKYSKEGYINDVIFTLKKYDMENNTDLLFTVEKYITCNCKGKETAEGLFIHPNTLNYRLRRIEDLTNFDFDDVNQRTMLYIDLLLQNYKE